VKRCAGIDGCRGGWVCVRRDGGRGEIVVAYLETAAAIALASELDHVGVDVPIGLSDAAPRLADVAARQLLGPRRSSVFPAPVRAVLAAANYDEARRLSLAACGRSLSKQTFFITPGIREIDRTLRTDVRLRDKVFEVHPEASFCAWNGGIPMAAAKRTPEGARARRRLIEDAFGPIFERLYATLRGTPAARDDLADAFAALWSAERAARGLARRLPDPPERDRHGLPMAITY
jgi:predicted RNase H-like nuclease